MSGSESGSGSGSEKESQQQRGAEEKSRSSSIGTAESVSSWDEASGPKHFSFAEHLNSLSEEVEGSVYNSNPQRQQQRQQQQEEPSIPSAHADSSSIPADQERQLLLLTLLGHYCALHDPTPRTFTVHVLNFFERGILDRQSIHFLYDLGLVSSNFSSNTSPTNLLLPPSTTPTSTATATSPTSGKATASPPQQQQQHDERPSSSQELALVAAAPQTNNKNNFSKSFLHRQQLRSVEASAIRNNLEQQEKRRLLQNSDSIASDPGPHATARAANTNIPNISWSAEHHPLSLSRYQREFDQVRLLSSGSFGHVYQATNKMDGFSYAIKRVPFSETGYSRESVQQVVREVHCLAVCDHPHVVRYYTSWLEPSWMTGAGALAVADMQDNNNTSKSEHEQKLLTDIEDMVKGGREPESLTDDLQAYFKDPVISRRGRSFSLGTSFDDPESSWGGGDGDEDVSEWTVKDDSYLDRKRDDDDDVDEDTFEHRPRRNSPDRKNYRYQICLFIQMQLCQTATLADWIRERNERLGSNCIERRVGAVEQIFTQIASGLNHVHRKGIIHRDLKPANVFAASEDGIQFKIGDFGLSRLIQTAAQTDSGGGTRRRPSLLLLEYQPPRDTAGVAQGSASSSPEDANIKWKDPLTAGVGTGSYAAPEQLASTTYGKEADIFSLGLMLLELLCCFSTEHERLQTFYDCRHRRKLPDELEAYPQAARTILECTEPSSKKRPSAEDLACINLLQDTHSDEQEPGSTNVQVLQEQLAEKGREIQRYKQELAEKDRTIETLQTEVERLRSAHHDTKRDSYLSPISLPRTFASDREGGADVVELSASSSSSSEDGI
jgi:translation initiation factor 2-alpha kinase 1